MKIGQMSWLGLWSLAVLLCLPSPIKSSSLACNPIDECSCEMTDGSGIYSLRPYDRDDGTARFPAIPIPSRDGTFLSFNPCTPFTNSTCTSVQACQYNGGGDVHISVGKGKMSPAYTPGKSMPLTFVYESDANKLNILLDCQSKYPEPLISAVTASGGSYDIVLSSRCGCKGLCNNSVGPGAPGLSLGSVLCIILLFLVIFYFALGIVLNKFARNKEGANVIPNKEFWTDLPSLVKDGCMFTYGKIKGSGDQYQAI